MKRPRIEPQNKYFYFMLNLRFNKKSQDKGFFLLLLFSMLSRGPITVLILVNPLYSFYFFCYLSIL